MERIGLTTEPQVNRDQTSFLPAISRPVVLSLPQRALASITQETSGNGFQAMVIDGLPEPYKTAFARVQALRPQSSLPCAPNEFPAVSTRQNEQRTIMLNYATDVSEVEMVGQLFPIFTEVDFSGAGCCDEVIKAATQSCPLLLSLKLTAPEDNSYDEVTGATLVDIAQNNPSIVSLVLNGVPNVTMTHILDMVQALPDLQELEIDHGFEVADSDLKAILEACPRITRLSIGNCMKVTDDAVAALTTRAPLFESLTLNLCNHEISAGALTQLFASLTNATNLTIGGFAILNDECIKALAEHAQRLTSCSLACCQCLTAEGVILPSTMARLESVLFSGVYPGRFESAVSAYTITEKKLTVNGQSFGVTMTTT